MIDKLVDILKDNDNYLILTHQDPDGDALGSALALKRALEYMGKQVDFYAQTPVAVDIEQFIDESEIINSYDLKEHYTMGICLDCSTRDYLYGNEFFNLCDATIVIDHHVTNDKYGNANIVSPKAAATAEIIYVICQKIYDVIPKEIADLLFVGIATDTGNFSYRNTTSTTHMIAAKLLKLGVDGAGVIEKTNLRNMETLFVKRLAYENIYSFADGRILAMVLDSPSVNADTETEGLVNDIRYIKGCVVAALVKRVEDGKYKVSLRSTEAVDVSRIAEEFEGGGHERAAGFTYNGDKNDILRYLKDLKLDE